MQYKGVKNISQFKNLVIYYGIKKSAYLQYSYYILQK